MKMNSTAIATMIKLMERLPAKTQERVVEHMREYLVALEDEALSEAQLAAAAQQARQAAEAGEAKPITRRVSGADGCRHGWVVLTEDLDTGEISWHLRENCHELIHANPESLVTAVDMPIGLPALGARRCDREARKLLGAPRASSVFPAPIRRVLEATTYEEACDIRFGLEGKQLSKQAWGIVPKIRELDRVLRQDPALQDRIREVHPEVSFYFLAGERPMEHSKKTKAGRAERHALLEPIFGEWIEAALAERRTLGSAVDDILDAFVALWSARRIAAGRARIVPLEPPVDPEGLRMEIAA